MINESQYKYNNKIRIYKTLANYNNNKKIDDNSTLLFYIIQDGQTQLH